MADQTVQGKLEIKNGNGSQTAVILNGNVQPQTGASIFDQTLGKPGAGNHFITGQIDIRDLAGNVRLSLIPTDDHGGWLRVNQAGSILLAGESSHQKAIELNAAQRVVSIHGASTIRLDAATGVFRIDKATGETLTIPGMLKMVDGRLRLGSEPAGGSHDGSVRLRAASGKTTVLLLAQDGSLSLRDAEGEERVRLDASGRLEIRDSQGDVLVVPGMLRLVDGRLRIGGEKESGGRDGSVLLRDASGELRMALDADNSRLTFRNAQGQETMHLNGETGDLILKNADCAEDFEVVSEESVPAGAVMVLNEDGRLSPCRAAYDAKVAGVVSGAGAFKPGIVLDRQVGATARRPIALMGKVFCQVDATYAAVRAGDLLTTSPTWGHAMRAVDPQRSFGAVIGKALAPLAGERGLVPILVTLQ